MGHTPHKIIKGRRQRNRERRENEKSERQKKEQRKGKKAEIYLYQDESSFNNRPNSVLAWLLYELV